MFILCFKKSVANAYGWDMNVNSYQFYVKRHPQNREKTPPPRDR
jgi:hypothetical protein